MVTSRLSLLSLSYQLLILNCIIGILGLAACPSVSALQSSISRIFRPARQHPLFANREIESLATIKVDDLVSEPRPLHLFPKVVQWRQEDIVVCSEERSA